MCDFATDEPFTIFDISILDTRCVHLVDHTIVTAHRSTVLHKRFRQLYITLIICRRSTQGTTKMADKLCLQR